MQRIILVASSGRRLLQRCCHTIVGFGGSAARRVAVFMRRVEPCRPKTRSGAMDNHWLTAAGIVVLIATVAGLGRTWE